MQEPIGARLSQGLSIRKVALALGVSRQTVRKFGTEAPPRPSIRVMRLAFRCAQLSVCLACGDGKPCGLAACGTSAEVELIDNGGNPVAARGEVRDLTSRFEVPFDCSSTSSNTPSLDCRSNVVVLAGIGFTPESIVDVRFELLDGSTSEWQSLRLHLTKHTDPDFNGPGCSCSGYAATVDPVVVPSGAQLPLPG